MNIWLLVLALIPTLSWLVATVSGAIVVREVSVGSLAELPCRSNDDNHRFMFWELSDRNILSPGNPHNVQKYNYDVLTGKLMIRSVSSAESGFYRCISRGIADISTINVQAVELIVKRDWEDMWENDFETNLLRGLAAVMVLLVTVATVLYVVTTKRRRNSGYIGIDASRENSPPCYGGKLQGTAGMVGASSLPGEYVDIDNSTVTVDFPKVFSQMHQEQAVGIR